MAGMDYKAQVDALLQPVLIDRVSMALFKKGCGMLQPNVPPLTAPTTQPQRDALVQQLLEQPRSVADIFARYVVQDETINSYNDIDDPDIDTRLSTDVIDAVAALKFKNL